MGARTLIYSDNIHTHIAVFADVRMNVYVCGKVSGVGSAMVATYAFTGPLASRLVSRYGLHSEEGKLIDRDAFSRWGTRVVCIMGALLSTCGLVLGSFAKTLEHIMVAYRCSK